MIGEIIAGVEFLLEAAVAGSVVVTVIVTAIEMIDHQIVGIPHRIIINAVTETITISTRMKEVVMTEAIITIVEVEVALTTRKETHIEKKETLPNGLPLKTANLAMAEVAVVEMTTID